MLDYTLLLPHPPASSPRHHSSLSHSIYIQQTQRMSKETKKSQAKMEKLRNEFGSEMINSWGAEHAAEALTPAQAAAVVQPE